MRISPVPSAACSRVMVMKPSMFETLGSEMLKTDMSPHAPKKRNAASAEENSSNLKFKT